jgi:hypothetical protein
MTEIENEGRVYVLKSEVENIIKERVSKVAQRATLAEKALEDAEGRLSKAEKAMSSVDILNQQLQEMKGKLSTAEKRFDRYQSISKHGLTDPDLVEAIEWSYERAQKGLSDKERVSLSDWLDNQVASPESAPITIRPHLHQRQMSEQFPLPILLGFWIVLSRIQNSTQQTGTRSEQHGKVETGDNHERRFKILRDISCFP